MQSSQMLRFSAVKLCFDGAYIDLHADPWTEGCKLPLLLRIKCRHLYLHVALAAQIFNIVEEVMLSQYIYTMG